MLLTTILASLCLWFRGEPRSGPSRCLCEHLFVRCDFCGSLRPRWAYPVRDGHERIACDECRKAIEGDDRQALLDRALLIPLPRTVPERYAPRFQAAAKRLHAEFWQLRSGPARPLSGDPRPATWQSGLCDSR